MAKLRNLTTVALWGTTDHNQPPKDFISSLAPLQHLDHLSHLAITGLEITDPQDFAALDSLESLNLENTGLTTLSYVPDKQLRSLHVTHNPLKTLDFIGDFARLHVLDISDTDVTDLGPVTTLERLEDLRFASTPVADLSTLTAMRSLQTIAGSGSQVADIAPLGTLPNLRELILTTDKVISLEPLKHIETLESLAVSGPGTSDLSALSDLKRLRDLRIYRAEIETLAPIANLDLKTLDIIASTVPDLVYILSMPKLKSLGLLGSQVRGLSLIGFSTTLSFVQPPEGAAYSTNEVIRDVFSTWPEERD